MRYANGHKTAGDQELANQIRRSRPVSTLGGWALLFLYPDFHPFGNLAQRSFQHLGDLPQAAHRRVEDSSFYAANVSAVEATLAAEALLRVARPPTEFSHDGPDGFQFQIGRVDLLLAPLHQQIRWCYFEAYQPTAYTPHLPRARLVAEYGGNWSGMSPDPGRMLYS